MAGPRAPARERRVSTSAGYDEFWIEDGLIRRQRSVLHPLSFQAEDEVAAANGRLARPVSIPAQPIVGVGAVIVQDGKVVLVKRRFEPLAGQWSLPGGRLELGETLEAGLAREMLEETGLEVEVGPVVDVFDRILLDPERSVRYHYVLIDYLCRPIGGTLAHGSDVAAAELVDPADLARYRLTPKATSVIEQGAGDCEDHQWEQARTLITGASAGIGAALADVFAEHGHDLILVARSREKLEARRASIREKFAVDVGRRGREDLTRPRRSAPRCTRQRSSAGLEVHHLVNNAGVGLYGKFATTDLDAELKMIQLNVTSVVELTKRFLPAMIARRSGRILNVASTAAFVPGPWMSIYYATKAFVLSFSEAIDYELKPSGITVTTLCPGPTESEFKVRAGSQRSRLFEAFVMDAPTVARVGLRGDDEGQAGGDSRPAEQADSDRRAADAAVDDRDAVAPSGAAVGARDGRNPEP